MKNIIYFIGAFLLIVFAVVVFRVFVHRDYQRKGRTTWLSIFLETLIFALHANFSYIFLPVGWPGLPALPENPYHLAVGLTLIAVGLVIVISAMIGLGLKKVFGLGADEIRKSGLYRFSRNPQLVAYGLVIIGFASLYLSWYSLGWVLLYGIIAHIMVLTEEEYLRKLHGEKYEQYCQCVPRWGSIKRRKNGR